MPVESPDARAPVEQGSLNSCIKDYDKGGILLPIDSSLLMGDLFFIQEMIRALLAIGFTEEAIAYGAKVHKSTISRIVTGKTLSPKSDLVNSVEEIFRQYCKRKII